MSLPRPGSMERAPTTNQRMDPWPSMELCPRSRGVGEPEGLGDPCLLPDPEGRDVWAPGLVPPFHFQIPQIKTMFASSCDRND